MHRLKPIYINLKQTLPVTSFHNTEMNSRINYVLITFYLLKLFERQWKRNIMLLCIRNLFSFHLTDGQWSDWTTWSDCSETCGGGIKMKTRQCTNPPPSATGQTCQGPTSEVEQCSTSSCRVGELSFALFKTIHLFQAAHQ
jgi:hypothetical protein